MKLRWLQFVQAFSPATYHRRSTIGFFCWQIVVLFVLLISLCHTGLLAEPIYVNEFAIKVVGGTDSAKRLADQYGFQYRGQIGSLQDYYLFEHHRIAKRSVDVSHDFHHLLNNDKEVLWFQQQHIKRRVKRDVSWHHHDIFWEFPDPLYPDQWFLHGGGNGGFDMNVLPAWNEGYTGKGIVVSILDDGIQTNHPDLAQNYDKMASLDINGQDDDPMPQDNEDNKHGTRCAGEVAAVAFNNFCGVGVAYNASIGGIRMLDGKVTDTTEATALSHNPHHIHIYSASWGPEDDGKTVDGPGPLAKLAFEDGIRKGRSGLGSLFVWASGNGGRYSDSCSCDGYANSIFTLSISSATQAGSMPWYLEQCSSTLATTYSSGTVNKDRSIVTVDMDNSYFEDIANNREPNPMSLCTTGHTGTSASAPIAAGMCALALEANPNITWRDMQYLVLMTSRPDPLTMESGWVKNGVGKLVSPKFGYGLMDAYALVNLAKQWQTVPPQHICETIADKTEREIPNGMGEILEVHMNTSSCQSERNAVHFLEHVQVKVTLFFKPRGNLKIILVSPAGTPSTVLPPRPHDLYDGSFTDWPFMSVHFWGESPVGIWKLIIMNFGGNEAMQPGKLFQWSLVFFGTQQHPINLKESKHSEQRSPGVYNSPRNTKPKTPDLNLHENSLNGCAQNKKFELPTRNQMKCVTKCPNGYYGDMDEYVCHPCHRSCSSCYGPTYGNCLSCPKKLFLSKSHCLKTCPEGYFKDQETQSCAPCSLNCLTCQQNWGKCISCKHGMYLYNQTCFAACPRSTFQDEFMCKKCHMSCENCYGQGDHQCIDCALGFKNFDGTCVSNCPNGYYSDNSNACIRCPRSCDTCEAENHCTACKFGYTLNAQICTLNSRCKIGWYDSNTHACYPCAKHCATCTGPKNDACLRCDDGFYWLDGTCVKLCPPNYHVWHNQECVQCKHPCKECNEHGACSSCKTKFFHDGNCVSTCPSGFYSDKKGNCQRCAPHCLECSGGHSHCTSCHSEYYLLDNTCISTCSEGYFPHLESRQCVSCYYSCKTCHGFGPMNCTLCHFNSSLLGVCIPCPDDEYFDKKLGQCRKCSERCESCDGHTEFNCLTCQPPLRLHEANHSCLPCCTSDQPKDYPCCSCIRDIETCVISSEYPRSVPEDSNASDPVETVTPLNQVVPIITFICTSAVVLFLVIFGSLQMHSAGWCPFQKGHRHYKPIPNGHLTRFDGMETVALTHEEEDMDEERDELDMFEKA